MRKKLCLNLITVCLVITVITPAYAKPRNNLAQLSRQIEKILASPPLKKSRMGIHIVSVTDGQEVFAHKAELLLIPASNMKILTSAAALAKLGPDYNFRTKVYTDNTIEKGKLTGNLYIKGFGDPFLVWEETVKIARYIHGLGLRQVTGNLVVDDSFFDNKRYGNGWKKEQTAYWYNAPLGALSVNFNTVEVNIAPGRVKGEPLHVWLNPATDFFNLTNKGITSRRTRNPQLSYRRCKGKPTLTIKGHLPAGNPPQTFYRCVDDPLMYAAAVFKDLLELWGVRISGPIQVGKVPFGAKELYLHKSKPLSLIIQGLNKFSNNFTAEQVLKTMGAEIKGEPGTAEKGLAVIGDFLKSLGIENNSIKLIDGSGLSRENRLTAHTLTKILVAVHNNFKWQPEFMASLPSAGIDGTLKKRMKGNGSSRNVRAKTGRLQKVAALSGYLNTKDNETLAFSMIMNDFEVSVEQVQALQDKICNLMINFSRNR